MKKRNNPSVSLNDQDFIVLERWKKFTGEYQTTKALKHALYFADNVALKLFGDRLGDLLASKTRIELKE